MQPSDSAVADALAPLGAMLAADDFGLLIARPAEDTVTLTVTAGPSACPTCLVPKDVARRMARRELDALARRDWTIEIGYPNDAQDAAGPSGPSGSGGPSGSSRPIGP
ncbi:hypothetical protein [Embleya sp. MST-111070]|uniref:hypothetical protein n=1 Tax=Embleya sp. MST-111070 TaxID=3398231 RepID=UPI003F741F15